MTRRTSTSPSPLTPAAPPLMTPSPQARLIGTGTLPLEAIDRDFPQARRNWRHDKGDQRLDELTASITQHGILEPLVVTPLGGGRYLLIAGHRRYVAAQRAGLREAPVTIVDASEEQRTALQLVENVQRQDLHPLDEAQAYATLLETYGSIAAVARVVGVSAGTISGKLRVLRDKVLAEGVRSGLIAESVARQVVSLLEPYDQPIRAKLQRGERVTQEDVLAARTQQGEDGVVHPHAVRKEPPLGYHAPSQTRGVSPVLPGAAEAPATVPPEEAGAGPDRDARSGPPRPPLEEELAAMIAAQAPPAAGPRSATPRPDPFDGVRKPSPPAPRAPFAPRRADAEAGYGRSPEALVAGRPAAVRPAVVAERPAADHSSALHALLAEVPWPALERLLEWAGARHYTAAQLLAACRALRPQTSVG
jgi:ParB family chromosome partitioning protein